MASIKAYYGRTYRGSKNRFLDFLQKRICCDSQSGDFYARKEDAGDESGSYG